MRLNILYTKKEVENICRKILKINNINNGYIRPLVFRSNHSMSPDTKNCKSLLAIAAWEWGKLFEKDSLSLSISNYPKLRNDIYPSEAKSSGSYQISVIERSKLEKTNYDDCLMLDLNKNVAETSACNIFWLKDNTIFTPLEHSILNGITRQCIIKLCEIHNIKLRINNYKLEKLLNAESVFITGTAAEIQKIGKIKKKKFNTNSKIIDFLKEQYEFIKIKGPNKINDLKKF